MTYATAAYLAGDDSYGLLSFDHWLSVSCAPFGLSCQGLVIISLTFSMTLSVLKDRGDRTVENTEL